MAMLLSWRIVIFLIFLAGGGQASDNTKKCKLASENERKAISLLEPLTNHSFKAEHTDDKDSYTYMFQVCGDADELKDAGVVQIDKMKKKVRIGNYTSTQVYAGSDWVMLIYKGGENYDLHCSQEARKAIIMVSCNRSVTMGQLTVIHEERGKDVDCFYLFELDSSAVCPAVLVAQSRLGTGSILLIVGFSCLAVYLIGGFLYQRLVVGAKGVEQFPNYAFWSEIGNLSADGCDFVCRSRGSREEQPACRGIATDPLEEPEERDDHLLPM